MDAESKTLKARITLRNENFDLKPEMFANVKISYNQPLQKVSVPSKSLIFDKSRFFVMVYHGPEDIETREVKVYQEGDSVTYLSSGLRAGEVVMTRNQLLVYDALND